MPTLFLFPGWWIRSGPARAWVWLVAGAAVEEALGLLAAVRSCEGSAMPSPLRDGTPAACAASVLKDHHPPDCLRASQSSVKSVLAKNKRSVTSQLCGTPAGDLFRIILRGTPSSNFPSRRYPCGASALAPAGAEREEAVLKGGKGIWPQRAERDPRRLHILRPGCSGDRQHMVVRGGEGGRSRLPTWRAYIRVLCGVSLSFYMQKFFGVQFNTDGLYYLACVSFATRVLRANSVGWRGRKRGGNGFI